MESERITYGPSQPVAVDFVSTVSLDHAGAVGESLGSEALAGHLKGEFSSDVSVKHIDLQLDPLASALATIRQDRPHLIGISAKIGALDQTRDLVTGIRAQGNGSLLVLGGLLPTFATLEMLREFPDVILAIGEGENATEGLVQYIKGEMTLAQVPGIVFLDENGDLVQTSNSPFPLNRLHLPARLTTKRIHDEKKGMIWFEGSRGCDGHCTFCSRGAIRKSGFSGEISPSHVADDIERLLSMGITAVSATDDDWGGDPERSLQIAEEFIARGFPQAGFRFSISTRPDHIYKEGASAKENQRLRHIMQRHAEAGLERAFLGLESGSQSQLKRYGKQLSIKSNYRAIEILRELGIDVVAGYIPVDPLMTLEELEETLLFLRKTGMYEKVSNPLSVLRVQEGSPYKTLLEKKGLLGERTEDLVFYNIKGYSDLRVQRIAALASDWILEMYPLIFGLKGKVAVSSLGTEKETERAQQIKKTLYSLREIEMQFIEALVREFKVHGLSTDTERITSHYKKLRRRLLDGLDHKALSPQLSTILSAANL